MTNNKKVNRIMIVKKNLRMMINKNLISMSSRMTIRTFRESEKSVSMMKKFNKIKRGSQNSKNKEIK